MTPKEKAEELIAKYVYMLNKTDTCLGEKCENVIICQHSWYACKGWLSYAKQFSLVAVDEILNTIYNEDFDGHLIDEKGANEYWEQVKQEIENYGTIKIF